MVHHVHPGSGVYVFARTEKERQFARELGAVWSGSPETGTPERLDAIIDTTPAWKPVVEALKNLKPGGRLVINAIRKEDADKDYLMNLDYPEHLWLEKEIKSVANIARRDVNEFLSIAAGIPIKPQVQEFPMKEANQALRQLKQRQIRGAKVLIMD
jgi:propanol-preferring alcohol dehydrogenase